MCRALVLFTVFFVVGAMRRGQSEQNTSKGQLGSLGSDGRRRRRTHVHDQGYEYMEKQEVHNHECSMDAYGGHKWKDHSSYYYQDDPSECKPLCDAQSNCAGFVDTYRDSSQRPKCLFKTSASAKKREKRDFFKKEGSPTPPTPPPPPPPGGTCLGGWPQFSSQAELDSDPWGNYFRTLYGSMPSFSYPLCIGNFWHFYDNLISSTGASAPSVGDNCPTKSAPEGQRYVQNNMYQPPGVSYAWHGPPYAAVEKNTWVEVSHKADPFGDEHYGLWFLYAKGNGIWFNTGETRVFDTHSESFQEFGVHGGNMNEQMSQAAAKAGFDSIQFTKHHDHVNYPCAKTVDAPYMSLEVVAVKLKGTYACGDPAGAPTGIIMAGWQGSEPCHCDTSKAFLNCGLFATHAEVD